MENKQLVGEVFTTKSWGDLKIIAYNGNRKVRVKFIQTGYEVETSLRDIRKGCVRDRLLPSVYGVGVVGSEPIVDKDGKKLKEYELWCSMLLRVYDSKKLLEFPTYKDCSISDNFKSFPYFKDWCNNQVGFNNKDQAGNLFHLDKDLLLKGNKLYSEDTCVFLPSKINTLLPKCDRSRGDCYIGVSLNKSNGLYVANVNLSGKQKRLGCFNTELEAFLAYKQAKENYIKTIAEDWKNKIDTRAYEALMNYQVEITD